MTEKLHHVQTCTDYNEVSRVKVSGFDPRSEPIPGTRNSAKQSGRFPAGNVGKEKATENIKEQKKEFKSSMYHVVPIHSDKKGARRLTMPSTALTPASRNGVNF